MHLMVLAAIPVLEATPAIYVTNQALHRAVYGVSVYAYFIVSRAQMQFTFILIDLMAS